MMRFTAIREGWLAYRFSRHFWRNYALILAALALPLMALAVAIYGYSQSVLAREIEAANRRTLQNAVNIVDTVSQQAHAAAVRVSADGEILDSLRVIRPETHSQYMTVRRAISLLELSQSEAVFDSITLYNTSKNYLIGTAIGAYTLLRADDATILALTGGLEKDGSAWVLGNSVDTAGVPDIPALVFYKRFTQYETQAVVAVSIRQSRLRALLQGAAEGWGLMALALPSGEVFFDTEGKYAGKSINEIIGGDIMHGLDMQYDSLLINMDGEQMMLSLMAVPATGWTCVQILPYTAYAGSALALKTFTVLSIVLGLAISGLLALNMATRLSRPIRQIVRFIDASPAARALHTADNELNYILMHLISVYDENRQLENERLTRFAALKNAQAQALQAQITPHFLHNALQAIQWLVIKETGDDDSAASRALIALSNMASATMRQETNSITLKEELDYLNDYMALQWLRYGSLVTYTANIADGIGECLVPRLCLQPLVENAIEHGIVPKAEKGTVLLIARRQGNDLLIRVEDSGVGIPPEELAALNRGFGNDLRPLDMHIGLANLNQRLRIMYGDEYCLRLERSSQGGLAVVMRMPTTTHY